MHSFMLQLHGCVTHTAAIQESHWLAELLMEYNNKKIAYAYHYCRQEKGHPEDRRLYRGKLVERGIVVNALWKVCRHTINSMCHFR